MITLSKKLCILFISSSLFVSMQGMEYSNEDEILDRHRQAGVKRNKSENPLEMLTEMSKELGAFAGVTLLEKLLEKIQDEAGELIPDIPKEILLFAPLALKKIEPIYQNLNPASKKCLSDILEALTNVMSKKIAETKDENEKAELQKFLDNAKPIIQFIKNNSNAGLFAQFSLLDLSGKAIVGVSLPLAVYGFIKAIQVVMHQDELQEELR